MTVRSEFGGEHVNPNPDPDYLWVFRRGEVVTLMQVKDGPALTFCVDRVLSNSVRCTEVLGGQVVYGNLDLNLPCVIAKDDAGPLVTLTLRRVDPENRTAWIQVSAHPKLQVTPRV